MPLHPPAPLPTPIHFLLRLVLLLMQAITVPVQDRPLKDQLPACPLLGGVVVSSTPFPSVPELAYPSALLAPHKSGNFNIFFNTWEWFKFVLYFHRGKFVTALGLTWCPNHFLCATPQCRRELHEVGFVEEQKKLYCEGCFEAYLAPTCARCSKRVKGVIIILYYKSVDIITKIYKSCRIVWTPSGSSSIQSALRAPIAAAYLAIAISTWKTDYLIAKLVN